MTGVDIVTSRKIFGYTHKSIALGLLDKPDSSGIIALVGECLIHLYNRTSTTPSLFLKVNPDGNCLFCGVGFKKSTTDRSILMTI